MMWEWMDRMLPQNPVTISFSPLDSQPQTSRTLLFSSLSIELAQWDLPKTDHDWLVIVELPQISSQRFSLFFHNFANFETNIRSFDHKYRGILYHKSVITVTIPFWIVWTISQKLWIQQNSILTHFLLEATWLLFFIKFIYVYYKWGKTAIWRISRIDISA